MLAVPRVRFKDVLITREAACDSWAEAGTVAAVRRAPWVSSKRDVWDNTLDLVATVEMDTGCTLSVELIASEQGWLWTTARLLALDSAVRNVELAAAYDVTLHLRQTNSGSNGGGYIDTALAGCCTCQPTARCSYHCQACWNYHVVLLLNTIPDAATRYQTEAGYSLLGRAKRNDADATYAGGPTNREWRDALAKVPHETSILYVDLDRASEQFATCVTTQAFDEFVHDSALALPQLERIVIFV